jgi:hypothetical protein
MPVAPAPTPATAAVAQAAPQPAPGRQQIKQTGTGDIVIEPPAPSRLDARPITPMDVEATEFKPAYVPIIEAAEMLGSEVMRGARGVSRGVAKPQFRYVAKYVFLVVFFIAAIWGMIAVLAPNWNKSGGQYSDQLRKFAPHLPPPVTDRETPP